MEGPVRQIAKNKEIGDLIWIPAGMRLWKLLDADKKIPKYKFMMVDEPKYVLVTGFTDKGNCLITLDGNEWTVGD